MVRFVAIIGFASVLVPGGGILGWILRLGLSLIVRTHARPTELILVPLGAALGCVAALTVGAHVAHLEEHRGKNK